MTNEQREPATILDRMLAAGISEDRAREAADRMEREETDAREAERAADEQRQRDDDRAREVEQVEQDRERVDY